MSEQELKIKITSTAELRALQQTEQELVQQITAARAAGKAYGELAGQLRDVQARIAGKGFFGRAGSELLGFAENIPVVGSAIRSLSVATGPLSVAFLGLTAAASGVVAMLRGVKGAADFAGSMSDLAAQTGQTVRDMVILEQVFTNAGLGGGAVGSSLNLLQKALAGVNEEGAPTAGVFARLGLSIEALKQMSAADALAAISEKIAALKTPADQTRAAMEMFGRSGGAMLAVMKDAKAFETARAQVGGLADSIGSSAEELDAFSDALGALDKKQLGFFAGFASGLAGDLGSAADAINRIDFSKFGTDLGNLTSGLVEVTKELKEMVKWAERMPGAGAIKGFIEWRAGGGFTGQYARKVVGGLMEIGATKRETEETRKSTDASIAAASAAGRQAAEAEPVFLGPEFDEGVKADLAKNAEEAEKVRLKKEQLALDRAALETQLKLDNAIADGNKQEEFRLRWAQDYNQARREAVRAGMTAEESVIYATAKANAGEAGRGANAGAAEKREQLDIELRLAEARAAGNIAEEKRLRWVMDYTAALKEAQAANMGDAAWDYARRKANAGATESTPETPATPGFQLSGLAQRGGSVGESLAAAAAEGQRRAQEAATRATEALTTSVNTLTSKLNDPLKVTATYG